VCFEKRDLSASPKAAQKENRFSRAFFVAYGARGFAQQEAQGSQVLNDGLTIRKGWEFDLIFRTGLRVQGELVRLLFLRGTETNTAPRAGYVAGKRQGNACVRNRSKRVLREAFRRLRPWVFRDVTVVVSLKDKALHARATEVYRDMASVLSRHGLLTPDWPGPFWR
jgi:ribonuclease P protein component